MIIREIEQNSEEWLEYRKGKSGGSEFKDLWTSSLPLKNKIVDRLIKTSKSIGAKETVQELAAKLDPKDLAELKLESAPKKHYYEIIADRVARPLTPNDYADRLNGKTFSMMERGHILEPEAKAAVEEKLGFKFEKESVIWEREDNPNIYISPDGWKKKAKNGKVTKALEIKCLSSEKVVEAFLTNQYPSEYFPQVCKYFIVNDDLEVLYFAIYTDLIPELELQLWEIHRNDVRDSLAEMRAYEDAIMARIDEDTQKITDLGF